MWYIYAIEYCSAIKENEVMPFAATWIDVEIVTLSEVVIQRKEIYYAGLLYVEAKKGIQMNLFTK